MKTQIRIAATFALALAIVGATGAPAQTPDPDGDLSVWGSIKNSTFPLNGWTLLAEQSDGLVFYHFPIQRGGAHAPRILTRWEFAAPQIAGARYPSAERLIEVDCIAQTQRVLRQTDYRAHNLAGQPVADNQDPGPWAAPAAATLAAEVFKAVCDQK